MRLQLTFEIRLDSDYHVSAGQRAGFGVDSALLRDHNNAPTLRGTALAGLLSDGLSDLLALPPAAALDKGRVQASRLRLFGGRRQRKKWAYSSASPQQMQSTPDRWGSQDVTRVRIDPRTRRAAPQQLFVEEEGDARLVFRFTATCYGPTERDIADAALLVAAARMVRHLGGARRRGRGECRIELVDAENFGQLTEGETWTAHALATFRERWLNGEKPADEAARAVPATETLERSGHYRRFRIIARTDEPLIISRRAAAGNAYETVPIITGTSLLGALATRAAHNLGLEADEEAPDEFVDLFLRGALKVTDLLPARERDNTLIPAIWVPAALFQCENYPAYGDTPEDKAHPLYNALEQLLPSGCQAEVEGKKCGGKLQPVTGFALVHGGRETLSLTKREEVHIQMNRKTGRASDGDLYEYFALEAGQWFVGELACDEAYWQRLKSLSDLEEEKPCELRLGKAAQRGYGATTFILQSLDTEACSPFLGQSLPGRLPAVKSGQPVEFSLLLLTDAIIVDSWNRFYTAFADSWVAAVLGVGREMVTVVRQYAGNKEVGGFSNARRMPRWRDEAITAGSVALVRLAPEGVAQLVEQWRREGEQAPVEMVAPTAVAWRLARLESEGIGLRTREGFGRVAFNHPVLTAAAVPQTGIPLEDVMAFFVHHPTPNLLQTETQIRVRRVAWLDRSQQEARSRWENIDAAFEPLARLIYLYRFRPLAELQAWLSTGGEDGAALGNHATLWGAKNLVGREQKGKVSGDGLKLVRELVEKLEEVDDRERAIALELLAERVARAAAADRENGGRQ